MREFQAMNACLKLADAIWDAVVTAESGFVYDLDGLPADHKRCAKCGFPLRTYTRYRLVYDKGNTGTYTAFTICVECASEGLDPASSVEEHQQHNMRIAAGLFAEVERLREDGR